MTAATIDRPKAAIAGAVVTIAVFLVLALGFIAGRATANDGAIDPGSGGSGEAPSSGPARMNGEVPVGFAHSEDGALAAGLVWLPWLYSSPVDERPAGIDEVLAAGVDVPLEDAGDRFAARLQFAPIAVKVEMESDDQATVTLLGPLLYGNLGEQLSGLYGAMPSTLEWDAGAQDWRITSFADGPADDYQLDTPLNASDLAGYRSIRPAGALEGSPIVEEVPGD